MIPHYACMDVSSSSATYMYEHLLCIGLDEDIGIWPYIIVLSDFKKKFSLTSLLNVDLYAMFCNLLDLHPSANNGSLSPACQMLSDTT